MKRNHAESKSSGVGLQHAFRVSLRFKLMATSPSEGIEKAAHTSQLAVCEI